MDAKAVDYIKTNLSKGKSKEEIYKALLNQGVTLESIQASFSAVTPKEDVEDTQKKTVRIILTIAALLIGAGIFSFIASNWQEMTKPIKLFVILIAMLSVYALGWYAKEKRNLLKTGDSFILLGSVIYGSGIFLVAQTFNVRANWPDGFILWMLGTIAMAFALESYPLFYLAIVLGIMAIAGHPFVIFTSVMNPFLLTSSFLLFVTTVVMFITGWVIRGKISQDLKKYF